MFSNVMIYSIITVILTVLVCFIISTLLPGIERKYVHARIQQRIGPLVIAPGIMAPLKFMNGKVMARPDIAIGPTP